MSFDVATLAAIVVSLVVVVFMIATVRGAERRTESKMRELARQTVMMQRNEAARELCRRVHDLYPDACAGLDFTFKEDEGGVSLDEWKLPYPRPEANRIDSTSGAPK